MSAAITPLPCFLVEWYRPELDEGRLGRIVADLDHSSISVRSSGSAVRRVLTLAVPGDDVVFGLFEAESADTVDQVCQRAGMPASRLTAVIVNGSHGRQAQ